MIRIERLGGSRSRDAGTCLQCGGRKRGRRCKECCSRKRKTFSRGDNRDPLPRYKRSWELPKRKRVPIVPGHALTGQPREAVRQVTLEPLPPTKKIAGCVFHRGRCATTTKPSQSARQEDASKEPLCRFFFRIRSGQRSSPIDVTEEEEGAAADTPIDVTSDDDPPPSPPPETTPPPPPPKRQKKYQRKQRYFFDDELREFANEQERLLAESRRRFLQTPPPSRWESQNPYVVLGVAQNSPFSTCRKAWLKLALQHHPDKSKLPNSKHIFDVISKAYQKVSTY